MNVFILQHEHASGDDAAEIKMIGVYRTEADALAARERLSAAPGFREHCDGFSIDAYELGQDHWTNGFHTVHDDTDRARSKTEAA